MLEDIVAELRLGRLRFENHAANKPLIAVKLLKHANPKRLVKEDRQP